MWLRRWGWGFVGALVGARALGMVLQADQWLRDPGLLLRPDKGGSVSFGAVLGALGAVWGYGRWRKLDVWALADSIAPIAGLALGFARLGCFMQGCDYGRITGWGWGVRYPVDTPAFKGHLRNGFVGEFQLLSLPVHPVQLVLAGFDFILFLVFLLRPSLGRVEGGFGGRRALLLALVYFGGRFGVEFLRSPYTAPMFGFLNLGQWFCVAGALCVWWLWRRRGQGKPMIAKGDVGG